ncbi:MAG: hypothetical protein V2A73_16710 [Pseudomonadota bacterium]
MRTRQPGDSSQCQEHGTRSPSQNNSNSLAADPSRLAASLVGFIPRVCALLAPCHPGASSPILCSSYSATAPGSRRWLGAVALLHADQSSACQQSAGTEGDGHDAQPAADTVVRTDAAQYATDAQHGAADGADGPAATEKLPPFGAYGGDLAEMGDELRDIGARVQRRAALDGLAWGLIQPRLDGQYNWAGFDANLELAQSLGITSVITVKSANQEDQENCGCQEAKCKDNPCDWDAYEEFLEAAVTRYRGTIGYWQFENEPEKGHYYTGTTTEYAELLSRSYRVVKEACPECQVLIAGMRHCTYAAEGSTYYPDLLVELSQHPSCGGTGCFDIFDVHTAAGCLVRNAKGKPDLARIHQEVRIAYDQVRALLVDAGLGDKPIWSTEFGPLEGSGEIAHTLVKSFTVALDAGSQLLFWRVNEKPSLILEGGVPTDSFYAYRALIAKLGGYSTIQRLGSTEGQYKLTFSDRPPVYVAWCEPESESEPEPEGCRLDSEIAGSVRVTDAVGNDGGTGTVEAATLTLTEAPVFVEK